MQVTDVQVLTSLNPYFLNFWKHTVIIIYAETVFSDTQFSFQ